VKAVAKAVTLIAACLLGSVAAGCGGGGASSPRDEISSFVVGYVDHNEHNCCEAGMHATVSHVTFAHSDPRWAVVTIAVTDAAWRPDGKDYLVLRKSASTWDVVAFGKGALGCLVPARIRAELAGGAPDSVLLCPPGG
jgi:hypothetical protein